MSLTQEIILLWEIRFLGKQTLQFWAQESKDLQSKAVQLPGQLLGMLSQGERESQQTDVQLLSLTGICGKSKDMKT